MTFEDVIPYNTFMNPELCSVVVRFVKKTDATSDNYKIVLQNILNSLARKCGLKFLEFKTSNIPEPKIFHNFLQSLHNMLPEPVIDMKEYHFEEIVQSEALTWLRQRWKVFPKYLEGIRYVEIDDDVLPAGFMFFRGVLTVSRVFFEQPEMLNTIREILNQMESGGLAVNVVKADMKTPDIKLRIVKTASTDKEGESAAKKEDTFKSHIAASYWMTYWATSELREIGDFMIPVAFIPRKRGLSIKGEKCQIKSVSPGRYLVGKNTIEYYHLRQLTKIHALEFDLIKRKFRVQNTKAITAKIKEMKLDKSYLSRLTNMLNKFAFIDHYLGKNIKYAPEYWRHQKSKRVKINIQDIIPYSGATLLSFFSRPPEEQKNIGHLEDFSGEVLAAINSIFFISFPEEFKNLHSAIHDPISFIISDGKILQPPLLRRSAFYITQEGKPGISVFDMHDVQIRIKGFPLLLKSIRYCDDQEPGILPFVINPNKAKGHNAVIYTITHNAFSPPEKETTPMNRERIDFVIVDGRVVEVKFGGKTAIPANGYVLSLSVAHGEKLFGIIKNVKNSVKYDLLGKNGKPLPDKDKLIEAFAAGPLLISENHVISNDYFPKTKKTLYKAREEFKSRESGGNKNKGIKGISPTRFPHNADMTRAPRTSIGIDPDGNIYFFVVDGRASLPHSVGVTLSELSRIIRQYGCTKAINLDGGGSSTMFVKSDDAPAKKILPDLNDGIVNFPSDRHTRERIMPYPIVFYREQKKNGKTT